MRNQLAYGQMMNSKSATIAHYFGREKIQKEKMKVKTREENLDSSHQYAIFGPLTLRPKATDIRCLHQQVPKPAAHPFRLTPVVAELPLHSSYCMQEVKLFVYLVWQAQIANLQQ